jgi:hypothetical protein
MEVIRGAGKGVDGVDVEAFRGAARGLYCR